MKRFVTLALALSLLEPLALFAQKPDKPAKGKEKAHGTQATEVTVVFSGHPARGRSAGTSSRNTVEETARRDWPRSRTAACRRDRRRNVTSSATRCRKGIVVAEVPAELSVRIGPAPAGYRYGILDGDLVKLAVGTLLVVDAIQGMVK